MFEIDNDMTVHITRGDVAFFTVTADSNGARYKFQPDDVVRIKVMQKKNCDNVAFQKDFLVRVETEAVDILLTEEETKIGDVISKPVDYWYEIELNPYNNPQTIIGYDEDGPKIFKVYPEGRDLGTVEKEDIPLVDKELSLTSERPIQNQAVARALIGYDERVELAAQRIEATAAEAEQTTLAKTNAIVQEAEDYIEDKADEAKLNIETSSNKALNDISTAEVEALNKIQGEVEEAEEAAERAKTEADRAASIAGGDYLPLTGGVSVKRGERTVFGVENTALKKASLGYWGAGEFMGELGVTGIEDIIAPFFRNKDGNENILATVSQLAQVNGTQTLTTPILEYALTLSNGIHTVKLGGDSYPANSDLPSNYYRFCSATIKKHGMSNITVEINGRYDDTPTVYPPVFNCYNGEAWSGWKTIATRADLANYLPLSGGTVKGGLNVNNGYVAMLGSPQDAYFGSLEAANDYTNARFLGIFNRTILNDINRAIVLRDIINNVATDYILFHSGNSAPVVITEDNTTPPSDTNALWVY